MKLLNLIKDYHLVELNNQDMVENVVIGEYKILLILKQFGFNEILINNK